MEHLTFDGAVPGHHGREMTIVVDGLTVAQTKRPTFEVHSYDGVIWEGNDEKIGRTIVEEHGEYAVLVNVRHDMMVTHNAEEY